MLLGAPQETPSRVTYAIEVVRAAAGSRRSLAAGRVSGPQETALRLALRSDSAEVEALFTVEPGLDTTVTLAGRFFTRRLFGRSRRGLPLWEQDDYQRTATIPWGRVARVYPFGPPRRQAADSLWIEIAVMREPAGGETRPDEAVTLADSVLELRLEAVTRPRRAVVVLTLVRGDSASAPRTLDLVVEAPARAVELAVGAQGARRLEVGLARPEPPRAARERALALDADVVCLRVGEPGTARPLRVLCGRLNNVARKLPLDGTDTLVATLARPGPR